jgi:hypothetical protein
MRKYVIALLLGVTPLVPLAAPPGGIERDLGQGLAYRRLHALPADLPAASAKPGALVLDLRYARGDAAAAAALGAWLQFHAAVRTPVFLLVNAATAPALLDFLEASGPVPGLVTLGPASSRFVPDLPLKIAALTERAAYEALEEGQPVASLLTDHPEKPRHDEAAIAREHAVLPAGDDETDADLSDSSAAAAVPPPVPPPLIDGTLQRAVHLHRALLALKKI